MKAKRFGAACESCFANASEENELKFFFFFFL